MLTTLLIVSSAILWVLVLALGFLMLGNLRSTGLLSWRVVQLEAITPGRIGRSGLKPGKRAPEFTLPNVSGRDVSLHDFPGRRLLLVFVQPHCGPCHDIVPELNRLADREADLQVLAVNNGEPEQVREWAREVAARFPVLVQERLEVSKRYQVFATPFAFLIDEHGTITSKGIVSSREHIGYVLSAAEQRRDHEEAEAIGQSAADTGGADGAAPEKQVSQSRWEVRNVAQIQ